jgi:hypothetical protein
MITIRRPRAVTKAFLDYLVGAVNTNFGNVSSGGYDGNPATIVQSSTYRFVSDAEKTAWNGKAAGSHNHDGVYSPIAHTHSYAPIVSTLANDQATGANTTPVTLSGLSFSYEANSKYRIWFMGRVSPAAATTGCGFQFDLSDATGVTVSVQFFHQLASTGTLSGGHSIADDASVGVSSGLPGTGNYPVTGFGLLVSTTNSGTAQLRFRSETTAVITARAGFTMVIDKL